MKPKLFIWRGLFCPFLMENFGVLLKNLPRPNSWRLSHMFYSSSFKILCLTCKFVIWGIYFKGWYILLSTVILLCALFLFFFWYFFLLFFSSYDLAIHTLHLGYTISVCKIIDSIFLVINVNEESKSNNFDYLKFRPGGSDDKESACNEGDPGLILGWRRSPR